MVFLNVCGISFEKTYDCKRINIKYIPPVHMHNLLGIYKICLLLVMIWKKSKLALDINTSQTGVDIWDTEVILEKAFVRDLDSRLVSKFDQTVIDITDVYKNAAFCRKRRF